MAHYDSIAPIYNAHRSDSIGVATVSSYVAELGWDVSVLDMGCGTGKPIAEELACNVRAYVGVEISPCMAEVFQLAVPQASCIVSDLATMELGEQVFDVCFSWGALCHLEPDSQRAALSIACKHTRVGGLVMFTGGQEAGSCDGRVGPHVVHHCSLGAAGYDRFLADQGCEPTFKGEVEGGFFLYVYSKRC